MFLSIQLHLCNPIWIINQLDFLNVGKINLPESGGEYGTQDIYTDLHLN